MIQLNPVALGSVLLAGALLVAGCSSSSPREPRAWETPPRAERQPAPAPEPSPEPETPSDSPSTEKSAASPSSPSSGDAADDVLVDWMRDIEEPMLEEEQQPEQDELDAALLFIDGLILVEAARDGKLSSVKSKLSLNVDPNSRDKQGNTALIQAAANGHLEIVKVLLAAGADRGLRNKAGQSAADVARAAGHQEILDILQAKVE